MLKNIYINNLPKTSKLVCKNPWLKDIIDYIYEGEVSIPQPRLASFMKASQFLNISETFETDAGKEDKFKVQKRNIDDNSMKNAKNETNETLICNNNPNAEPVTEEKVEANIFEENNQGLTAPNNISEKNNRKVIVQKNMNNEIFENTKDLDFTKLMKMLDNQKCYGIKIDSDQNLPKKVHFEREKSNNI